jgi:hypothetical protein
LLVARAEFNPVPVLELLVRHDVDFVLVGGLAAAAHGTARATFDIDIVCSDEPGNARRLAKAVREAEATFPSTPVDLRDDPGGAPAFYELWAQAMPVTIRGLTVRVASLDHLIAMKEAGGRPQDKLTAWELRAVSDELRAPQSAPGCRQPD